ncbi:LINE-1 retrotransposable element ORF2 protein [Linum perenne]
MALYKERFPAWNVDFAYEGELGKIWLLWKHDVPLKIMENNGQYIHVKVELLRPFYATFIYGSTDVGYRRRLYASLQVIKASMNESWILAGDFNSFLDLSEAEPPPSSYESMEDFKECVNKCELIEHFAAGPHFTWINNRTEGLVSRRLDRVLVNIKWQTNFPDSRVSVIASTESDHCALFINSDRVSYSQPKSFKFFSCWIKNNEYKEIVSRVWNSSIQGSDFYVIFEKLRRLKFALKDLNKRCYSDIQMRVREKEKELLGIKEKLFSRPSAADMGALRLCNMEYEQLRADEESIMRQKAKVHWIKLGDQNTAFFFNHVKARNSINTIRQIKDENGEMVESQEDISRVAVAFYKKLLGEQTEVKSTGYDSLITLKLLDTQADEMVRPVSRDEVKRALFSIPNEKAPGPDGYNALFFKDSWNILENDLLAAVLGFFDDSKMPPFANSIYLALIPKKKNAEDMGHFRPISCCSVIYKVISKVMANRLSAVLPFLVSKNQTAFIKGRNIGDGVLLAHELLSTYKAKATPRCAIQIDLQKSFDSVEWSFIIEVMKAMRIPDKFVKWIETCLNASRISVNINGSLSGYFPAKRGFRQGDPISPFLFVLSMEVLSCLFAQAVEQKKYAVHPQCKSISLTHLCFADDLLVFAKASSDGVKTVKSILERFHKLSGLRFNSEKSKIYIAGLSAEEEGEIVAASGFSKGAIPFRYLGVPLTSGKLRRNDCKTLLEKITKRVTDWKSKKLSYAGKLQLIDSVISEGGKSKVAWDKVAKPKKEGGVGIKDFRSWNVATVVKHLWQLIMRSGSLWVAWVNKYRLKGACLWGFNSEAGSWHWKRLMKIREVIRPHVSLDSDGELLWDGKLMGKFKTSEVWNSIRPRSVEVDWFAAIWTGFSIPKRGVVAWLIVNRSLMTANKIKHWNSAVELGCMLCKVEDESIDHLFGRCCYTKEVMDSLFPDFRGQSIWQSAMIMKEWKLDNDILNGRKLLWRIAICRVWIERCRRVFCHGGDMTATNLIEEIKQEMVIFANRHRIEKYIELII